MCFAAGGYRDALKFRAGSPISFDAQVFVESRPVGMQAFLRRVLQLQLFDQFISERLSLLNTGQGFTDEFENESTMIIGGRTGSRSQYHDWLAEMRVCCCNYVTMVLQSCHHCVGIVSPWYWNRVTMAMQTIQHCIVFVVLEVVVCFWQKIGRKSRQDGRDKWSVVANKVRVILK